MKILLTGDLHLGRSYQKEAPAVAERLQKARLEALENAVEAANREKCQLFMIAGDLYDKVSGIPKSLHKSVCQVLDEFAGQAVLILPGNHDYYDPESDTLWRDFEECSGTGVRVMKTCEPICVEGATVYPCPCHNKRSKGNALGWLKEGLTLDPQAINIGIAHGAVEGYSLDAKQEYYQMGLEELQKLGMDLWLIGHTHVDFSVGGTIFNAGTPQQTDIADNSKSRVFILEIDEAKHITCRAEKVGVVDFVRREVTVARNQSLEDALAFPDLSRERTCLRVFLSGVALPEEHEKRGALYEKCGEGFLKFEVKDEDLKKMITPELIDKETLEGTTVNRLLKEYTDDLPLLDLAYSLVLECQK